MKRIHLTLVLVTVFCVAAFAANAGANTVGTMEINAGYVKSSTDLGTTTEKMGGGIGFGAGYWRNASPTVQWGVEVSWDNLGTAEASTYDPINATTVNEKFSSKVIRVNPALRVNFGSPVGPSFFAQGGAGLYNVAWDYEYDDSSSPTIVTANDSSSEFGFNLGAGVGFPVGPKTKLSITGSYHIVPGNDLNMDDTNNMQFKAGIGFGL